MFLSLHLLSLQKTFDTNLQSLKNQHITCGILIDSAPSNPRVSRMESKGERMLSDMKKPLSQTQSSTWFEWVGEVECGGHTRHWVRFDAI